MAKSNLAAVEDVSEDAPYGRKPDGTPRKRPARSGETRKAKPIRVVAYVDEQGKIVVLHAGKDFEKAYDVRETNPGSQIVTVNFLQDK